MKIEIWLDFTCPYSFIGKRRFDLALEKFEKRGTVDLEFKSFELAPNAVKNSAIKNIEVLMKNFNKSKEEALEMVEEINRSEEHTSELQSRFDLVCRLLLEKK